MIYTLRNEQLTVQISDLGAEIRSVQTQNGEEWIYQGSDEFWEGTSPVLFPYCGRIWNNLCTVNGVPCQMGLHGFFMHMQTKGEQISDTEAVFVLCESEQTLAQYPFSFEMRMIYTLKGRTLTVRAEITNTGNCPMPYGYGVHPGFCIPAGQAAQDCYLEFPAANKTHALCLDASECYPVGGESALFLERGNRFYLPKGDLSAVWREEAGEVLISCGDHRITMRYPDFSYLTLWRPAGGPFVCVEPWTSIPSVFGEATELTEKADLVHLEPQASAVHCFDMTIG